MRLTILTRASELARLQGLLVERTLQRILPGASITRTARDSSGDRDRQTPLWQLGDKGAFTSDLSDALTSGAADLVVHSWKDLPIEPRRDTLVAATLPRGDARDVLLIRQDAADGRTPWLRILSSSPRRALMLGQSLPELLPWPVETIECLPVRGNVPTRIERLMEGAGDGLVVAKAALDRLLDPESPFAQTAAAIRASLAQCRWIVLPLREHPAAAAQGALAIEIARSNAPLEEALQRVNHRQTWRAVVKERELLARFGGGCHQAIGANVLPLPFGDVISVRGRADDGQAIEQWTLARDRAGQQTRASAEMVWPRPDERDLVTRSALGVRPPDDDRGWYVTRDYALPHDWPVDPGRVVWVAGPSTWRKLAARGVWVNGSAEGLGVFDPACIDRLAGRAMAWHRLTHAGADVPDALPTYDADVQLPPDLATRTHFFWRSASEFRKALAACPGVRDRWHACGPGHTFEVVERIAGPARVRPVLAYEEWFKEITS